MSVDPEAQDTPGNSGSSDTPEIPWQKRYEDLRPEFDRTTQALKEQESVWNDEDALLAAIGEKYPHLLTDDDEAEEAAEFVAEPAPEQAPPHDPRLDKLLPVIDSLQSDFTDRAYQKDLAEFVGDRELTGKGQKFVRALCAQNGYTHKALEGAVNEWFELFPEEEKPKRKAPVVLPGGKTVEDGPVDWSKMSRTEIDEYMAAKARALDSQT